MRAKGLECTHPVWNLELLGYSSKNCDSICLMMESAQMIFFQSKIIEIFDVCQFPDFAEYLPQPIFIVPNRIYLLLLTACLGIVSVPTTTHSQALLPYTPKQDPQSLTDTSKSLLRQAAGLVQFQQYEQAIPRVALATQLAPKNHEAWFFLGTLYVQTQKYQKGIDSLLQAKAIKPQDPEILFMLGSAYFQKGDNPQAIETINAGLKIKPDNNSALFDLGNAYYKSSRYPDAIAQYQKAVKKDPKFWPAINNIGLVSYETGDLNGAIQNWQKAIAIDPKAAEPTLAIAVALFTQGKQAEAFTTAEKAISLDSRYANIQYLKDNLWGDKLLNDTRKLIQTPRIRDFITKAPSK
jgi:tetratricopeptide (TPR) repeat protein